MTTFEEIYNKILDVECGYLLLFFSIIWIWGRYDAIALISDVIL